MNEPVRFGRIVAPLLRERTRLLVGAVSVGIMVGGGRVVWPRKWVAQISVSTVEASGRQANQSASLATALLGGGSLGLQASPALIMTLARSQNTLGVVGHTKVPGRGDSTLFDILLGHRAEAEDEIRATKHLGRMLDISLARDAGLVTISAESPDSAISRLVANRLIEAITNSFLLAVHSQAEQTLVGLRARRDSAESQLERAESRAVAFLRANRDIQPYSEAALTRDRLLRDASMAGTAYSDVMRENQAAYANELEGTPALAVVDPVPRVLGRVPASAILWGLGSLFVGLFIGGSAIVLRSYWIYGDNLPEDISTEADALAVRLKNGRRQQQ